MSSYFHTGCASSSAHPSDSPAFSLEHTLALHMLMSL